MLRVHRIVLPWHAAWGRAAHTWPGTDSRWGHAVLLSMEVAQACNIQAEKKASSDCYLRPLSPFALATLEVSLCLQGTSMPSGH